MSGRRAAPAAPGEAAIEAILCPPIIAGEQGATADREGPSRGGEERYRAALGDDPEIIVVRPHCEPAVEHGFAGAGDLVPPSTR
jgi:hypothetical protein